MLINLLFLEFFFLLNSYLINKLTIGIVHNMLNKVIYHQLFLYFY